MENDFNEFLENKSKDEVLEFIRSLDKEKYPELYHIALAKFDELAKLESSNELSGPFNGEYANVFTRFGAIVIDGLLSFIFYLPVIISLRILKNQGDFTASGIIIILSLIAMLVFGFWNSIFRMGKTGQSLGRKFLNIAVLNSKGLPIGIGRAALREIIGRMISGLFCYIGYLNAFWDKKNQMWHDKIADCYVYYVEENFS